MVAVSTYSWEEVADPAFGTAARQAFRQAVAEVAEKAKGTLPECNGRVDLAVTLVLAGDVELLDGGLVRVASGSTAKTTYLVADGTCECKDFAKAPSGWCKHRIAAGLMKRAVGRADALLSGEVVEDDGPPEMAPAAPTMPTSAIPSQYLVVIQGKQFVLFAGLLALAHSRGLTSLTADWTYNDPALSLAHATAVFPFGTFTESGDASPDNCTKKVAPHFRRVALTRAKARCLRDALNVDMVSLEELAE